MTRWHGVPFLLVMACVSSLPAQAPCPPGDINQYAGAWRARPFPQPTAQFRPAAGSYNRATADRTLETILGQFRAAYPQPTGTNAYFDRDLTFSTSSRDRPFGYSLILSFSGFYCTQGGQLVEYGESGVFVNVDVNRVENTALLTAVSAPYMNTSDGQVAFNPVSDDDSQYTIGGRRIFKMPAVSGQHRGVDYYAENQYSRDADPPDWQWFVFRKADVPLLLPVTRREYVQQFRSELVTFTEREIASRLQWARQSGDDSGIAYVPIFARGQAAYLQAVDDYLKRSGDAELARSASEPLQFLPRDPDNPTVRFPDGDRVMAVLNPAYMDQTLPVHVPQFIVIQLSARATRHPWERNIRDRLSADLDFNTLQALIGR